MAISQLKRQSFGPKCPSGGTWYACGDGTSEFVGCCARDPCKTTCAYGDLYPAGFNSAAHGTFSDAKCGTGVSFWTCTAGNTFLGCCKSNPCGTGICPKSDLEPASLNTDALRAEYGANGTSSSASASRSTQATSTPTGATATASPHKNNTAAIAGGAAGGVFVMALVIGLLIYYVCFARKSRKGHTGTATSQQSDLPAMAAFKDHDPNKGLYGPDAPPGYTSPNINNYHGQQAGQYYRYSQQPTQEPQELPTPLSHKAFALHQRNVSELSGDTTIVEMDTPGFEPKGQGNFATPPMSPYGHTDSQFLQPSPANTQPNSPDPGHAAHYSWQGHGILEESYEQGLGVRGVSNDRGVESARRDDHVYGRAM